MPREARGWTGRLTDGIRDERNQGHVARTLDGAGQLALKFGRGARNPAGQQFALIVEAAFERFDVFVINVLDPSGFEPTLGSAAWFLDRRDALWPDRADIGVVFLGHDKNELKPVSTEG